MLNLGLVVVIFRLALAATFAVAGIAKLLDKRQLANSLREFGVPQRFSAFLSKGLPLLELAVAMTLLSVRTAAFGASAALLLLLLFVGGMIYHLARGRRPRCNCFGQMGTAPIGPLTVVRNVLLAGFAVLILSIGRGPSIYDPMASIANHVPMTGLSLGLLVALVLFQGFLTFQVLRQQGRILVILNASQPGSQTSLERTGTASTVNMAPGLGIGRQAPFFSLPSLAGNIVSLPSLLASGKNLLFLFMNPHCGPCVALVEEAVEWMHDEPAGLSVFIMTEGTPEENLGKTNGLIASHVFLQKQREVADAYHAWGTPAAVIVSPHGTLVSEVAQGAEAIRSLLGLGAPANGRRAHATKTRGRETPRAFQPSIAANQQ
jgi:thiol-disulfide isomerase/thioredoxin/uncharacterized membrane protein YphA (DoxX/SURF4 family)